MLIGIVVAIIILLVIGAIVEIVNAPEGFEDDNGFHLGKKKGNDNEDNK